MTKTREVVVNWPYWECVRCKRTISASWATMKPDGEVMSSGIDNKDGIDLQRGCNLQPRVCLCDVCRKSLNEETPS